MREAVAGFNRIIKRCPKCKADGPKELVSQEGVLMALCPECQHVFHHERPWGCGTLLLTFLGIGIVGSLVWHWRSDISKLAPALSAVTHAPAPLPPAQPPPVEMPALSGPTESEPAVPPVNLRAERPAPQASAEARARAVKMFPDLARADSQLNRQFLQRYQIYLETRPEFFDDPEWPTALARDCALGRPMELPPPPPKLKGSTLLDKK
jgi:hypothetical protein